MVLITCVHNFIYLRNHTSYSSTAFSPNAQHTAKQLPLHTLPEKCNTISIKVGKT